MLLVRTLGETIITLIKFVFMRVERVQPLNRFEFSSIVLNNFDLIFVLASKLNVLENT